MKSFGLRKENQEYVDRYGSYAIVLNDHDQICLVRTSSGFTLPGGGSNHPENPLETLYREVREETGFQLEILKEIGLVEQFVHAIGEGYFRKVCHYFLCSYLGLMTAESEVDHEVHWCSPSESLHLIENESAHGWALRTAIRML